MQKDGTKSQEIDDSFYATTEKLFKKQIINVVCCL